MKPRKPKPEPSLLDQLHGPLKDFVSDFKNNAAEALKTVRERDPSKYLELSTKLLPLVAALNPASNDFAKCQSFEDIGRTLLKSVGADEFNLTTDQIEAAIAANNKFIEQLAGIAQLGQMEPGEPN